MTHLKDSKVGIVWKTVDPGSQKPLTGSFNPIYEEPNKWYGDFYVEKPEDMSDEDRKMMTEAIEKDLSNPVTKIVKRPLMSDKLSDTKKRKKSESSSSEDSEEEEE